MHFFRIFFYSLQKHRKTNLQVAQINIYILLPRIKDTEESKKIFTRYEKLISDINDFKRKYFDDWAINVPKIIESKSKNTILARQGSDLVLNFSPTVSLFKYIP